MKNLSWDRKLVLTCEIFNRGQFATKKVCTTVFNIKISILKDYLTGIKSRAEIIINLKKLFYNNKLILKYRSLELDLWNYLFIIIKI